MTTNPPEIRAQLAAYRRATAELRQAQTAQAQARAHFDQTADALQDARARAEAQTTGSREERAALVRLTVTAQDAEHRTARDLLREAETALEHAKLIERTEREALITLRVMLPAHSGEHTK